MAGMSKGRQRVSHPTGFRKQGLSIMPVDGIQEETISQVIQRRTIVAERHCFEGEKGTIVGW